MSKVHPNTNKNKITNKTVRKSNLQRLEKRLESKRDVFPPDLFKWRTPQKKIQKIIDSLVEENNTVSNKSKKKVRDVFDKILHYLKDPKYDKKSYKFYLSKEKKRRTTQNKKNNGTNYKKCKFNTL